MSLGHGAEPVGAGYSPAALLRHFGLAPRDIRLTVREMQAAPINEGWRLVIILISAAVTLLDTGVRALHVPSEYDLLPGLKELLPAFPGSGHPLVLYPLALLTALVLQIVIFYVATLLYGLVLVLMRTRRAWADIRTGYVAPELVYIALTLVSLLVSAALYAVYGPLGRPRLAVFQGMDIVMGVIFLAYAIVASSQALAITAGRAFVAMLLSGLLALLAAGLVLAGFDGLDRLLSGALSGILGIGN